MKIEDLDEDIRKKVENKQKIIISNANLRIFGYVHSGKNKNNAIRWFLYISKSKTLEEKIKVKQKYIRSNEDLSIYGYNRARPPHEDNKQEWVLKSHSSYMAKEYVKKHKEDKKELFQARAKRYNQTHKKERVEWQKEWRNKNPEKERNIHRRYRKTPNGKIAEAKHRANRNKKGFLLLFKVDYPKEQKIDFHHIAPNLPFVIPVPREIHKSIHGSDPNHYLGVTIKFCEWLKEHPEIKIMDRLK